VDECKPLADAACFDLSSKDREFYTLQRAEQVMAPLLAKGRGLHSPTFRLNVSAFCGIGGAFNLPRGCLGGMTGYQGVLRVLFDSGTAQVELNSGRV
jgi:hypothetical protein